MSGDAKTVKDVLEAAAGYLDGREGIDNPRLTAEHLASRLLDCKRLDLYLRYDTVLSERRLEAMRRGLRRVAGGEPLQYVLGQWDFMGHRLKVDKRALIPRPETERLASIVAGCEDLWNREQPAVVDLGTGCGCIVISLALARPEGSYSALDTSEEALSLARENAAAHGVADRIDFACAEMAERIDEETLDAVVANLPYVPTAAIDGLQVQVRNHEPRQALDGGPDGLAEIGPAIRDAAIALKPGGRLFLEIGEGQAAAVGELLRAEAFTDITVSADDAGRERVAAAVAAL